ncbi:hypothetical protein AALO_G00276440 [Alosa alosa]|uniref:Uncharacterized protein n=1 Tax=Alosa alosa TaxID=278164 RepID=A0AAV6FLN4_9TELE|nr:hypothetical protein AALO_G00276440 [Alosa alosa]
MVRTQHKPMSSPNQLWQRGVEALWARSSYRMNPSNELYQPHMPQGLALHSCILPEASPGENI